MSAFNTRLTRGDTAATTSTACFTTAITSSHSPSTFVNMALVSLGRPEARTTRTASATAVLTLPDSSPPAGLMLNATITVSIVRGLTTPVELRSVLAEQRRSDRQDHPVRGIRRHLVQ